MLAASSDVDGIGRLCVSVPDCVCCYEWSFVGGSYGRCWTAELDRDGACGLGNECGGIGLDAPGRL